MASPRHDARPIVGAADATGTPFGHLGEPADVAGRWIDHGRPVALKVAAA